MNKLRLKNLKSYYIPVVTIMIMFAVMVSVGCKKSSANGEESGIQYSKTDTMDETYSGARCILSYNPSSNSFNGTVENTTNNTLRNVRVEIHLSSGQELGPTTPQDLAAGQTMNITLQSTTTNFTWWSAHPEVN